MADTGPRVAGNSGCALGAAADICSAAFLFGGRVVLRPFARSMWFVVASMTLPAALIGCNGKEKAPKELIIGTWSQPDSPSIESFEFTKEGALRVRLKGAQQPIVGNYKFIDDTTIETDIRRSIEAHFESHGGGSIVIPWWAALGKANVSVSQSELTIIDKKNKDIFRRQR